MIKGGEKVALGMAYGVDENGNKQDMVFEVVDNRQRFAAVLVGMPANQYKTAYAFRGYAVLTKDGKDIIVYGPVMSRSIYQLAEQLLEVNAYEEGSTAYAFLKQLIADGDAAAEGAEGATPQETDEGENAEETTEGTDAGNVTES